MLDAYLTDTITLRRATRDQWGETQTLTETEVKARTVCKTRLFRDQNGEMSASDVQVEVAKDTDWQMSDTVALSGDTRTYSIGKAEELKDFVLRGYRLWLQ